MTLGLAFYIVMLIWLFWSWPGNTFIGPYGPFGGSLLLFFLFLLLGWRVFGPPLHG